MTSIVFWSTWEVSLVAGFLTNIISAPKRKAVYGIYSVVGLGIGATQAGFSAVEYPTPDWLRVFLAVYAFVGTAIGATAASNVDLSGQDGQGPPAR